MASKKKSEGSGIQQAAGLIRYFDEESEHAWKITPFQVYAACIIIGSILLPRQPRCCWSYLEPVLDRFYHHNLIF